MTTRRLVFLVLFALFAASCLADFDQFYPEPTSSSTGSTADTTSTSTTTTTTTTDTTSTGEETVSSTSSEVGGAGGMGGAGGATSVSSSISSTAMSSSVSSSAMSSSSTGLMCNPVTEKDCNGSCVLINDPDFGCTAGGCAPCSFPHVDAPICASGMCAVMGGCATGYADCDMQDPNGCEAHLADDPLHCGMCMHACGVGESCSNNTCVPKCGNQPIPATGDAVCWVLSSATLGAGTYGTITVSLNAPALSGPSDPITSGCVSQQAATANDSTDPSVLCPIAGAMTGSTVYLALKAYASNVGNPPLPFAASKCDNQDLPTGKCVGTIRYYHNGVLVATFTDPPVGIFSYHDTGAAEPLEVKFNAQ